MYHQLNARVVDKAGDDLIGIISKSVGRMLRRKMDAVRCILKKAESAAQEFDDTKIREVKYFKNETIKELNLTYYSSKYSPVLDPMTGDLLIPERPNEAIKNVSALYE